MSTQNERTKQYGKGMKRILDGTAEVFTKLSIEKQKEILEEIDKEIDEIIENFEKQNTET